METRDGEGAGRERRDRKRKEKAEDGEKGGQVEGREERERAGNEHNTNVILVVKQFLDQAT